jgi:hypothetical protein
MYCEHVYKEMDTDLCPLCSMPTHRIDWKEVARLHKEWIDSGKATPQGWWSI